MGKVNTRNGLIEFYRFVFACLIIAFHGAWISGGNRFIVFGGGYLAVEFFFILSGFFLVRQVDKESGKPLIRGMVDAVVTRYKKLAPYFFPVFAVLFVIAHLSFFVSGGSVVDLLGALVSSLYELLLLCMMGTIQACPLYNPPIWYCSALILSVAILYPMVHRFRLSFSTVIAPLLVLGIYGYLTLTHGSLNTITDAAGPFYTGLLRAIAAMCVGVFLYGLIEDGGKKKADMPFGLSVVASLLLLAFIFFVCWRSSILDFLAVLAFALLIYVAMACERLAGFFSSPLFAFLGKLSLPLYICQWIAVKAMSMVPGLKAGLGSLPFAMLYLALCIAIALAIYLCVYGVRRTMACKVAKRG